MPRHREELASLEATWGPRLTVIPGEQCTKRSVMEALAGEHDIVHFLCHGTFNWFEPLRSALHFCSDRDDDRRQLTARDILHDVQLTAHPLVVMSACSSGMTADSRTNSFHGLPGSLFRVGARAIIGSRWPVYDGVAADAMARMHHELRSSNAAADICLSRACGELREQGAAIEDGSVRVFRNRLT